jgi:iron complex outermembrane receptor protein
MIIVFIIMKKTVFFVVLISLNAILNAFQQGNSVIRGRVSDEKGNGLPGAVITIEKRSAGTQADSKGNYSFSSLSDGSYTLRFSFIGFETVIREVALDAEAVLDVTLASKPYITDEVMISATRAGKNAPMAYSTVSSELIRQYNSGQDLPYLLTLTPSLIETSEAGNGIGYTSLRIRGTDGSRINVTIDGIPLNDAESQQVFWVDLPDIAASTDNIQVQRGAGTSSNGAGAFGATISIQTKAAGNKPFAEINSSFGSFNTFKNSIAAGTGLLAGKFAFEMRYSDLRSDGYIERTGSKHSSMYMSALYRTAKSSLKANIIHGKEHTGIGWWGVPVDSLNTNRRYNPAGEYTDENGNKKYYANESDNYMQDHYQLIYNRKLTEGFFLSSAFHYTRGSGYYEEFREDQQLADYGLDPVFIGNAEITQTDLIRQKWMKNDFYGLVYSFKYKNEKVDAAAGGGANLYLGDHFGDIIWMAYAGNNGNDYRWYFNESRKGEISLYGKINYKLTEMTSLFGDLQYRNINYKMSGVDDDLKDISQQHNFGFFNPKAGLFFSLSPDQDAWLSFSVANREPTRSDFKEASGDANATPKPETLYDTELGYSLRKSKSSFGANLYAMYYNNQLVPTGELSNVGYPITTNVAKSYRIGVELTAGIRPAEFFSWDFSLTLSRNKIADFVEYYTDYNTTDWTSEYLSKNHGDVDIAYSPSIICSGDLKFALSKSLSVHLISKYAGKQYFDNTMSDNRSIDPYFVNNVRFDYSPLVKNIKGLDFQFILNNIFNAEYENNAYGGNWYEDGIEKTWAYYFPQAGINFMVRLGVRF